jgi:hypothetical protein
VNEKHKKHSDDVTLAEVTREMNEPRIPASVRKVLETSVPVNCRFRTEDCVYNRDTKEHGLVKQAYDKESIIMYEVWLPATPNSLRWGHFVSDWAEDILEPSDKLLVPSARLPPGL